MILNKLKADRWRKDIRGERIIQGHNKRRIGEEIENTNKLIQHTLVAELPPFHLTQPGDTRFTGGGFIIFFFTKTYI
jgi:hypothetical protein